MKKNRIALKLSIYFASALLIFSIIIGVIFMLLFNQHSIDLHKKEITQRATMIADTIAQYMGRASGKGSYGAFFRSLGDIAGADVWVVDEDLNLITGTGGMGMMHQSGYTYSDLPENAEELINQVFADKTVMSEDFSGLLSQATLTVGTPIKDMNSGKVLGVVLIHSPVQGTDQAVQQGLFLLLVSILIAIAIVLVVVIGFSIKFTKPLNKMKNAAQLLAQGDYHAKTHIEQKDEIGDLAKSMDELADRLDDASKQSQLLEQMRKDFVANVSHELKTPITVIRGSLEALVEKVVTESEMVDRYHQQMLNEALILQRLVGDLLELSRLQNTDFKIDKEPVLIAEVINDVVRSAQQIASKREIELVVQNCNFDGAILGDYSRIRQMLMIILDNAIKFSPEKSQVEVIFEKNRLIISDHGIGIAEKDIPFIFERFYQARDEREKKGTGLGLAIARQIAERHNIEIFVQSQIGIGSKFTFIFSGNDAAIIVQ